MTNNLINAGKVSKVEVLKQKSDFLRGPINTELNDGNPFFSQDGIQILKFHGSYQQKDRDLEKAKAKGEEAQYSMMLRTRSPGGFIPWQLYVALDKLSDHYGNHTLRATTRQGFQLHGILKEDLKAVIVDITKNMGSTVGACGDINRNVMAPPAPFKNKPEYDYAREYAVKLADLLAPQAGAYYDIWLDGEVAVTASEAPEVTEARKRQGAGTAKTNISDIDNSLNKVEQLKGVYYNLMNEEKRSIGLIAQDVEKIIPEVVHTNKDNTKSIAYGNMIALLVESIKELNIKIKKLEEKL